MDEFLWILEQLHAAGKKISIPVDINSIEHFIRGLGGVFASEDNMKASGYMDSDATVQAFVDYVRMMPDLSIHRGSGVVLSWDSVVNTEDMGVARASRMIHPLSSAKGDYAVLPIPSMNNGERHNTSLMSGLAILKDSPNQDLAWVLMTYVIGASSEAAMDLLAHHSLEVYTNTYRRKEISQHGDLLEWIKRDAEIARPASFDMTMNSTSYYGLDFPYFDWEEAQKSNHPDVIRRMLEQFASQYDAYVSVEYRRVEEKQSDDE